MSGFSKSPWIIHYDASSCNGCDIETLACLTPMYDVERLGVVNTGNPKHADIFLVTGAVNEQSRDVICNIYRQMPEPKVVVAVGVCASTGGIFRECYNVSGGIDTVIPVDVYVPGCAARPEAIIDGVVQALSVLEEKHQLMSTASNDLDKILTQRADKSEAAEILTLQKIAYQSATEIYGDDTLPVLQQSLADVEKDFETMTFLKAEVNGKIIGSIRGYLKDGTAHINRITVHPYFSGAGLGGRLLQEMENAFPEAKRFEAYTGEKSTRNIDLCKHHGYEPFKTEVYSPAVTWVYLQKERK